MLQDKYDALENQYRTAQNDLSNAAQSQYILNALGRFVAYPPVAATIATQRLINRWYEWVRNYPLFFI